MSLNKKSVDDINVKGKRVLCRCDFNVPLKNGEITDENRLVAALPTIKKLIADGGKVILCSHLGKVKTEEDKQTKTLAPVAKRLTELLGQEVKFVPSLEVVDDTVKAAVDAMKDGEVILLENTRFRAEETKNGEAFSKDLASICDVFVNDAFGTAHRAHCSNVGVAGLVDTAVVGYLMQKEIDFLGNAVENPVRPFVAILGGAKVADKLNVISNLLEKCDTLIIGGGMAYTFLKAKGYEIGKSLVDDSKIDYCKEMMAKAESLGKKLLLPVDTVMIEDFPNPIDDPSIKTYLTLTRCLQTRKAAISDLRLSSFTQTQLRQLRQLFGMDLWVYSRTLYLQPVQRQLQQHLLIQMLQQSSVVEIQQQQLTSLVTVQR